MPGTLLHAEDGAASKGLALIEHIFPKERKKWVAVYYSTYYTNSDHENMKKIKQGMEAESEARWGGYQFRTQWAAKLSERCRDWAENWMKGKVWEESLRGRSRQRETASARALGQLSAHQWIKKRHPFFWADSPGLGLECVRQSVVCLSASLCPLSWATVQGTACAQPQEASPSGTCLGVRGAAERLVERREDRMRESGN